MHETKVLALVSLLAMAAPASSQMMQAPMSMPLRQPVTFDAVYVVNGGDGVTGSISVINAETNTVAGTIQLMNAGRVVIHCRQQLRIDRGSGSGVEHHHECPPR